MQQELAVVEKAFQYKNKTIMKRIGNYEGVTFICDNNMGSNTFWAGSDTDSYFDVSKSRVKRVVTAKPKFTNIPNTQQTNSSTLLVPNELDPTMITWIVGSSEVMADYMTAYMSYINPN